MDDYFDKQIKQAPEEAVPEAPMQTLGSNDSETADHEIDTGTSHPIKAAVQELLKYGLVEQTAKPNIYRTLQREDSEVTAILEPLDLSLCIDDVRGIAYLLVVEAVATDSDEAWRHPLLRRQRLTTEQSLLVAILRQYFVSYEQDCGIGATGASVDLDDLLSQFNLYLGSTGSEKRDHDRLRGVIDQLHRHGICGNPDKESRIAIRPIIVHLANPTQLQLLLTHLQQLRMSYAPEPDSPVTERADDA